MRRHPLILVIVMFLAVGNTACKPPPSYDMAKAEIANTVNKIHIKEAEDITELKQALIRIIRGLSAYLQEEKF